MPPQDPVQLSLVQSSQPIRISTSLVQVPVSVTDPGGNPIKSLQLEDFVVEENGRPVAVAHMGEPGKTSLDTVLVFDVTGSVFARFDFEQQAASSFLQTVFRPGDAVSIICIASQPRIVLERAKLLQAALEGLAELRPSGASTAFFDSVIAAARLLPSHADPETRRVQIVLSDGEDNYSEHGLSDAIQDIQRADCIFYAINPSGSSIRLNEVSQRGQQAMEELAKQTGGYAFLAEKLQDLPAIYGRIAAELQAQYLLSYYPPDGKADGSFRRIVVRVPQRPDLRVRSRQGYYASKSKVPKPY